MLTFRNFSKSYGYVNVLTLDHYQLQKGIYWIQGANGSGKSTLLKSIAGVLPFRGDVILGEKCTMRLTPVAYRRRVNYAEAEPIFPDFLTGMELIKVFAAAKGAAKGQENYFLESMNMLGYINEPVGAYSSGMVKKLSIVLAFLGQPDVILLDEPLITVDKDSLNVLSHWIREKYQCDGTLFLMASHQVFEADIPATIRLVVEDRTLKNDSHATTYKHAL